ncbi:MAG: phosphatidylglycerophosphatase A [Desulfobulbaceae bacterium]|nr:phosphatidylglycerophosphatase A [Desulfobulbaceae bacterium]
MDRLILFIATGAGSGYLPKAPGTWGSLVGVFIWLFICKLTPLSYFTIIGILFVIGVFAAGGTEKIVDRGDPGLVVIDEIVGQLIALALMPTHVLTAIIGFALFRLFDILKPFPVSWLDDHLHGGLGIMLDDVAAGIYALIVMQLGYWLIQGG